MKRTARAVRTDGEATRARILDAAGRLFADAGFAEATSKAIAAQAGVDLASINYHFGGRDGLYEAVLMEAHHRLVGIADLQQLSQSPLAAEDKLKALIAQLVRKATAGAEAWHLNVLAAELLAPSSHIEVLMQTDAAMKISLVMPMLEEITGIPPHEPALLRCLLSVVAPCMMLLIGRRGLPGHLQQVRRMPAEETADHLHRFAIAGLKAIGSEYAARHGGRRTQTQAVAIPSDAGFLPQA